MADWTGTDTKESSVSEALAVRNAIKSWYSSGKSIKRYVDKYNAGTDPAFNAALNALYTAAQRAELGVVAGKAQTSSTDLETNHASLVGYVAP